MAYADRPWLKSYDPGVRPDTEIPPTTIKAMFEQAAADFPDRAAFHFMGVTVTYKQLLDLTGRFARGLADRGLGPGDAVGVNLPNLPQYVIALLGALRAGCSVTGVSPLLTPDEMTHQLNDSQAKAFVTLDAIFEHRFTPIAEKVPGVKLVIPTNIADYLPRIKGFLGKLLKKIPTGNIAPLPGMEVKSFKEFMAASAGAAPEVNIGPEAAAFVQYTGGTTGPPKGAILAHANSTANMAQWDHWLKYERGTQRYISAFPMFHAAGLMIAIMCLCYGHTQIMIPDPRNTGHIIKEFAKYRPTGMVNVPSLYMMLMAEPEFRNLDFSTVNVCVSGAAPYPVDGIRDLEAVVGEGKLLEVWGMTETSPLITANPMSGAKRVGSVGLPLPNTIVRVVDLNNGVDDMPVGEEGELIACGPQVMQGYHNKPEESKNSLREHDGRIFMHTGDVGRMDEDGFFYVVDRAKDMIIVGGYKVFSSEVEDKLYQHPSIELCALIGVANPDRPDSEIVKLVMQKSEAYKDQSDDAVKEEITAFAREKLSPYKVPKIIEIVDEIPLTAVGKVDKKALRV